MFETLKDVEVDLITRLVKAARDRRSPMHVPVVVTSDVDARVMVLREFNPDEGYLRFHTDIRAPKVSAIATDPRMAVLLYDQTAKIQIRLRGKGRVLGDHPITDAAWDAGDNFARRCYLGEGPGSASDTPTSGLPEAVEGIEPSDEQLVPARENFAVLLLDLEECDWLYLAHTGHMRAKFTRNPKAQSGQWHGRWVTP